MDNEDKDKKIYELALLTKTEDGVGAVLTLVKQHNGELVSEPRAKKLALAYEIKGETEAIFSSTTFRAAGEDAKNLERDLNTNAQALRFLILIAPPVSDRQPSTYSPAPFPDRKRGRPVSSRSSVGSSDAKPSIPRPLSNEALEKKIEEILQ